MNILRLKRIFYLFITLAVVGVLVTSCERENIIEDDLEGVKEIIIEEDLEGVKTTRIDLKDKSHSNFNNFKKGEKILLRPNLLMEYINILMAEKKLTKVEIADAINNITIEELRKVFTDSQLADGIIEIPANRFAPVFVQPCGYTVNTSGDPDNPDYDLNMSCDCMEFNFQIYEAALGNFLSNPTYQNCIIMASAECNVAITEANCYGNGPIEDCSIYYEFCYDLDDEDECPCSPGKWCLNDKCVPIVSPD